MMSIKMRKILLAGIAPAAMLAAAHAQQAAPAARNTGRLQDVTVTAARRTQNLQKVSAAVSVVSGSKIASQGLTNVEQILSDVPSVQTTGLPGGFAIDIRGQGGDLPAGSAQGSVDLEFDGVYAINPQNGELGFFDVNHMEVLAGPQSTRYGPDADGGVVNVITNDPVIGSKAGSASFTVGSYSLLRGEFAQNIPLGDVLAMRVAGAAIYRNSYFTTSTGLTEAQSGRVKLLYKPNDDLSVKLSYQLDHLGGAGEGSSVFPESPDQVQPYADGDINKSGNPWAQGDYAPNGLNGSHNQSHIYQNTVTLNGSYQINDWLVADELASYLTLHGTSYDCFTFPPAAGPWQVGGNGSCYTIHQFAPFYQYSSETRIHNPAGTKIQWNLGYYHWTYYNASYWPADSVPGPAGGTTSGTKTDAVYGEMTYPVTKRFRVIGGLRESFDQRTNNFGPDGTTPTPTFARNMNHFDYRAGFEYDLTPKSMEYFTVSTGYRPGGNKGVLQNAAGKFYSTSFGAEVNTSFELGTKNRFLNNRLQINGDVFYYKQDGYQDLDGYTGYYVGAIYCNGGAASINPLCQVPALSLKAHTVGLEGQLRFLATPNDQLGLNFTWMDAEFDKHQTNCAAVGLSSPAPAGSCEDGFNVEASGPTDGELDFYNLAGATEPHSPKFADTFTYSHSIVMANGALSVGGELFYTTGYYVSPIENAYTYQPSYWMAGLNANYTPVVGNWSIGAYVHNLNDYAVKEMAEPVMTIGDPRTYGLNLNYKW